MKKIRIKNKYIKIDNNIFKKIVKFNIYLEKLRGKFYPRTKIGNKKIFLSKLIKKTPKSQRIGYWDKDTLNLQKSNLYFKNKKTDRIISRIYYLKNNNKLRAYHRKRHKENPESYAKSRKKYRDSNKGKAFTHKNNRTLRSKWRKVKEGAVERDFAFYISYKHYQSLFENPYCSYCNKNIRNETGGGLDRINNNRGYYKDNVLLCCGDCNRTRGRRFTVEEMKGMMKYVLKNRNKKH